MRIQGPTNNISGGPTGAIATFSPARSTIGESISNVGRGLTNYAISKKEKQESREEQQRSLESSQWSNEAYTSVHRSLIDFMDNPERSSSKSLDQDLMEFIDERSSELYEEAPDEEAIRQLKRRLDPLVTRYYERARSAANMNIVSGFAKSVDDDLDNSLLEYRSTGDADSLSRALSEIESVISESISPLSPETSEKLKSYAHEQVIIATMSDDPDVSRALLENSKHIDEGRRKSLMEQIDRASDTVDLMARDSFSRQREQAQIDARSGRSFEKMPLEQYEVFYGEQAPVKKKSDDLIIDAFSSAHVSINEVSDLDPRAQRSLLSSAISSAETKEQLMAVNEIILPHIKRQERMIANDRTSWLIQNNPEVRSIHDKLQSVGEVTSPELLTALNESVLKYQGPPPPDAKYPNRYLNLPAGDRSIMTKAQAEAVAASINKGSPEEVISTLDKLMEAYPDAHHASIALNDLVTLPDDGIRQEYQLAILNKDAWWLDSYTSSLKYEDQVKTLSNSVKEDISAMIDSDERFVAFRSSLLGDNMQRAEEVAGFKTGIEAFASSLVAQGHGPDEAVVRAIDRLINERLGIATINDEPIIIPRETDDGRLRTDEEVEDIGRRLGVALSRVDPRRIDQTNFSFLQEMSTDEGDVDRLQALRDAITMNGFWQISHDGQSAYLYMRDDDGMIFQVSDKDGSSLEIMFDDLPDFSRNKGYGRDADRVIREKLRDTYDLQTVSGSRGNRRKTTYFPTADFIR